MKIKLDPYLTMTMKVLLERLQAEGKLNDQDVGDIIDATTECVNHACYQLADEPILGLSLIPA